MNKPCYILYMSSVIKGQFYKGNIGKLLFHFKYFVNMRIYIKNPTIRSKYLLNIRFYSPLPLRLRYR